MVVRPVVSSMPRARFMHWTAPPAVPLVRLSRAATAISRRGGRVDGHLHVHRVGAQHRLRLRPLPAGQQPDEGLVGVGRRVHLVRLLGAESVGDRSRAGGEDAARHRHQHRGEGDPRGRRAAVGEVLDEFGNVPVHATHAVRTGRSHQLRAEQVRLEGPARPGRAAGGHDHHVGGVGQSGRDGGQQGQRRGRRVATRYRDPPRPRQLLPLPGQLGQPVGPGAGVRRTVEGRPGVGIGKSEVRSAVDDHGVGIKLRGHLGRGPVRQGQEHDVVAGQRLGRGLLDRSIGERRQMRLVLAQRACRHSLLR